jgi:uncharacterized protein YcbX
MTITLTGLHIYPVKALGGISLDRAETTSRGLKHDRRFMVVDGDGQFVTQREMPKMATVWVALDKGRIEFSAPDCDPVEFDAEPRPSPTRDVRVWRSTVAAHTVSPEADRWLSDYLGFNAHLMYMPDSSRRECNTEFAKHGEIVSFADGYPFLVTSEASLDDLNTRIAAGGGAPVPMNRFRPNLVVKGASPFAEDGWREVRIGAAIFRAVKPCGRCQVTTTDQVTGEIRGPEPLATLASFRSSDLGILFGMNLTLAKPGPIRVGDQVFVD